MQKKLDLLLNLSQTEENIPANGFAVLTAGLSIVQDQTHRGEENKVKVGRSFTNKFQFKPDDQADPEIFYVKLAMPNDSGEIGRLQSEPFIKVAEQSLKELFASKLAREVVSKIGRAHV